MMDITRRVFVIGAGGAVSALASLLSYRKAKAFWHGSVTPDLPFLTDIDDTLITDIDGTELTYD